MREPNSLDTVDHQADANNLQEDNQLDHETDVNHANDSDHANDFDDSHNRDNPDLVNELSSFDDVSHIHGARRPDDSNDQDQSQRHDNSDNSHHEQQAIHVTDLSRKELLCAWFIVCCVLASTVLAFMRHTDTAVIIFGSTAIALGFMRLMFREHSLWKVRSIAFDVCIAVAFGIGLIVTYYSIIVLLR